jgi:YHS domain-containing protein
MRKSEIIFAALLLALTLTARLTARSLVDPVNKSGKTAIKGYDPVAYFTGSGPVKGSPQFPHQWMGAEWRFASAANRDLFAAAPEKYAPQYGGYCAYAVSENYTANIDPEAWKIVDGKLYLNYSKSVQKIWMMDQARRIAQADRNWPGLHK